MRAHNTTARDGQERDADRDREEETTRRGVPTRQSDARDVCRHHRIESCCDYFFTPLSVVLPLSSLRVMITIITFITTFHSFNDSCLYDPKHPDINC